jgi:hypothetical protein
MAARRLLIVMLILLGVSSLAGVLLQEDSLRQETTASTTTEQTETTPTGTAKAGERLSSVIVAKPKLVARIPVEVGDQLSLVVCSNRPDQVEIPALGLIGAVLPAAPARFELIAEARGSYGVRLVEADRLIARIEVTPATGTAGSGGAKVRLSREQKRCGALAGGPPVG